MPISLPLHIIKPDQPAAGFLLLNRPLLVVTVCIYVFVVLGETESAQYHPIQASATIVNMICHITRDVISIGMRSFRMVSILDLLLQLHAFARYNCNLRDVYVIYIDCNCEIRIPVFAGL